MKPISLVIAAVVVTVGHLAVVAGWQGDAGNAQHTAVAPAPAQNLNWIRWTTPIDL